MRTCSVQAEDGHSDGEGREQVGEEGGRKGGGGRLLLVGDCGTGVAVAAFAGVPAESLFVMETLSTATAHEGGCRDVLGKLEGVRLGGSVDGAVGVGRGDGEVVWLLVLLVLLVGVVVVEVGVGGEGVVVGAGSADAV